MKRGKNILLKHKKGDGSDVIMPMLIRAIVYIAFFSVIAFFLYKSQSGAIFYEQAYSKDIALLLDKSRSGTTLTYDIENGIEIAKKNELNINNIVFINSDEGYVDVRLSIRGGYRYYFFNDVKVESQINQDTKSLILTIKEK